MLMVIDELTETTDWTQIGAAHSAWGSPMEATRRAPRILLAEDDVEMRRFLAESLRRARFEVVEAEHGTKVLDYIATCSIAGYGLDVDLVISDIRMPGADGLKLASALRSHQHDLPIVLITAFGNPETHDEALLRGARAVIDKPFDFAELLAVVRQILHCDTDPDAEVQS